MSTTPTLSSSNPVVKSPEIHDSITPARLKNQPKITNARRRAGWPRKQQGWELVRHFEKPHRAGPKSLRDPLPRAKQSKCHGICFFPYNPECSQTGATADVNVHQAQPSNRLNPDSAVEKIMGKNLGTVRS